MLQGKKIFIIEPSRLFRSTICSSLEQIGATTFYADSSDTALMEIIQQKPDVIISSVSTGAISGFDLCLILKLMPDYSAIPIIIISSTEEDLAQQEASDAGADYYVTKGAHTVVRIQEILQEIFPDTHDEIVLDDYLSGNGTRGKVLLVDDSSIVRRIVSNMLKKMNVHHICEAHDGMEALEILEKEQVGLIFTDWNMPRMDGIELVKTIRSYDEHAEMPIVMLTTEGGSQDRERAIKAGASDHISKPFSMEKIKTVVDRFSNCVLFGKNSVAN